MDMENGGTRRRLPNSRALGAGAAGPRNMPETCAAVFNPRVWTYTTAARKSKFPSWSLDGLARSGAALCAAPHIPSRPCVWSKVGQLRNRVPRILLIFRVISSLVMAICFRISILDPKIAVVQAPGGLGRTPPEAQTSAIFSTKRGAKGVPNYA